jgi:hypothetical protein
LDYREDLSEITGFINIKNQQKNQGAADPMYDQIVIAHLVKFHHATREGKESKKPGNTHNQVMGFRTKKYYRTQ